MGFCCLGLYWKIVYVSLCLSVQSALEWHLSGRSMSWLLGHSKMSAASSTTEGGRAWITLTNLDCWEVISLIAKISSNCMNQFLALLLYGGNYASEIAALIVGSFST